MKLEIDIPSCGHPERIRELKKLRNQLIELTAWAGWLDGRWTEGQDVDWYKDLWPTFNSEMGEKYLKLAERDLGFKREDV